MAAGGGPAISPLRTPDLDDEDHERLDAMNADIEGNYDNSYILRIFSAILYFRISV